MTAEFLSVCRPLLPGADAVAAWLRESDAARHYTNRGPLVRKLEARLSGLLALPDHALRTTSSGTSAIEVAVLATSGPARPDRPFAMLPSYTFAATALAVERLGFQPLFLDVAPETWALDPMAAAKHPMLGQTGVIVPVAPYGRAPDMRGWEAFQAATGVPVVVDAAASFERLLDDPALISATVPMTVSFHATKTFSTGEGGGIFWLDAAGQDRVVQVSNFGFHFSRQVQLAGTNAKMSDYHAAVGHAMLDGFADRRAEYASMAARYARAAAGQPLPGRLILPPEVASAYVLLETPDPETMDRVQDVLTKANIETRRWYESGLHGQPWFRPRFSGSLPVTDRLSRCHLGLPAAHDLTDAQITRVITALVAAGRAKAA